MVGSTEPLEVVQKSAFKSGGSGLLTIQSPPKDIHFLDHAAAIPDFLMHLRGMWGLGLPKLQWDPQVSHVRHVVSL